MPNDMEKGSLIQDLIKQRESVKSKLTIFEKYTKGLKVC